ncbi:hypothetical protein [Robbsia andropogonis]|uniref:hypothetical protein n=1 Tax=Robbsia andropogonis TaxID=28092 RepID=UPI002A6B34ED|nr:hypothetical protein [Robbsia andropogonis]
MLLVTPIVRASQALAVGIEMLHLAMPLPVSVTGPRNQLSILAEVLHLAFERPVV